MDLSSKSLPYTETLRTSRRSASFVRCCMFSLQRPNPEMFTRDAMASVQRLYQPNPHNDQPKDNAFQNREPNRPVRLNWHATFSPVHGTIDQSCGPRLCATRPHGLCVTTSTDLAFLIRFLAPLEGGRAACLASVFIISPLPQTHS